ncbi:MAG: SRPBCC family protein [Thermoplasmatota archaeon]
MARYYSDDGIFDAPVEAVWQLIDAHTDATVRDVHPATVEQRTIEERADVALRDVTTRMPDGSHVESRIRFTERRPHTQTLEFLGGPFAGSWQTTTYVPEGGRTRLVTVGEFRLAGAPDEVALHAATAFVDNAHEEDRAYLARLVRRAVPPS